jgi:hypothetical protein
MAHLGNILLLLLISSLGIAQIGVKVQQQNKIPGLWQNSQFGYQMTLMLNPDGSGEFDGEIIKFTTLGNTLSITQNGIITKYTYTLQGNSLALSGVDLEGTVNFSRGGRDESIPDVVPSGNLPDQTTANPDAIIGIWSGNNEMIEFRNDGRCTYLGNTFQYQLSPGHVTLVTGQGNVMFAYLVKGDRLSLTGNNQTVTYSKGAARIDSGQQNRLTGKGQIAMELVGKWCYVNVNSYNSGGSISSTCITLNEDGTYEYYSESSRSVNTPDLSGGTSSQNSDRGTWYLQGDRIYYNSRTQGSGSYRLEKRNHPKNVNDPMIILDGEAYVTAYNKPPWR